jgi:hypothetical protein
LREEEVAFAAVLFIATILAFLLVLVRIAGKRWQTEGRFAGAGDSN